MTTRIFRRIFGLLLITVLFAMEAYADTFEFLTYTPPPSGWTKQMSADGGRY